MEQATATPQTEEHPETIEYGGLIWTKDNDRSSGIEYEASQPECGKFRVYQYPNESPSCAGRWLWAVNFNTMVKAEYQPAILQMEASKVVDKNIEAAMQACLDAKDIFIADIKQLSTQLGIGNYATGYMDGQAKLAEKIKMVLP